MKSRHEVGIYDADPDTVVSVTVRELRCLCTDEWECCASDEDDSDIAIPERTCHIVLGDESNHAPHCDACGGVVYEMMPSYCHNCGARVVSDDD